MTKTKFTPGPWKRGDCDRWIIWAPAYASVGYRQPEATPEEGVVVAVVEARAWAHAGDYSDRRDAWLAESDATSNLVAAAPDLYAALEALLAKLEERVVDAADYTDRLASIQIAGEQALAKARGDLPHPSNNTKAA